jgi:glycosyltransferase involved in cell wall biosynthesis
MFSIYILTHNEELDIAACIESALLSDDVIVVDSYSSDRTMEIAQRYPVRVVQHSFESHGKQRTWMLESVLPQHEWVYILEADERMTPALFQECLQTIQSQQAETGGEPQCGKPQCGEPQYSGYYVAERVMFMGRWIRRCTQYPRYQMRLFQHGKVWFEDYGHTEREVCEGRTGFLRETYPHYTSGKGFSRWIDKHNRYSSDEATETLHQLETGDINWHDLLWGKTEVERRRALKNLSLRLPLRPVLRFFYMYFGLGGCLDGAAGFHWCLLQAFYEYLILLKVWEIQHLPVPKLDPELNVLPTVLQSEPDKFLVKT